MFFELDEGGIYRLVKMPSSGQAKTCLYSEVTYGGTWFPPIGDTAIIDMNGLSERQADLLLDVISEAHGIGALCGNLVMFDCDQIEEWDTTLTLA